MENSKCNFGQPLGCASVLAASRFSSSADVSAHQGESALEESADGAISVRTGGAVDVSQCMPTVTSMSANRYMTKAGLAPEPLTLLPNAIPPQQPTVQFTTGMLSDSFQPGISQRVPVKSLVTMEDGWKPVRETVECLSRAWMKDKVFTCDNKDAKTQLAMARFLQRVSKLDPNIPAHGNRDRLMQWLNNRWAGVITVTPWWEMEDVLRKQSTLDQPADFQKLLNLALLGLGCQKKTHVNLDVNNQTLSECLRLALDTAFTSKAMSVMLDVTPRHLPDLALDFPSVASVCWCSSVIADHLLQSDCLGPQDAGRVAVLMGLCRKYTKTINQQNVDALLGNEKRHAELSSQLVTLWRQGPNPPPLIKRVDRRMTVFRPIAGNTFVQQTISGDLRSDKHYRLDKTSNLHRRSVSVNRMSWSCRPRTASRQIIYRPNDVVDDALPEAKITCQGHQPPPATFLSKDSGTLQNAKTGLCNILTTNPSCQCHLRECLAGEKMIRAVHLGKLGTRLMGWQSLHDDATIWEHVRAFDTCNLVNSLAEDHEYFEWVHEYMDKKHYSRESEAGRHLRATAVKQALLALGSTVAVDNCFDNGAQDGAEVTALCLISAGTLNVPIVQALLAGRCDRVELLKNAAPLRFLLEESRRTAEFVAQKGLYLRPEDALRAFLLLDSVGAARMEIPELGAALAQASPQLRFTLASAAGRHRVRITDQFDGEVGTAVDTLPTLLTVNTLQPQNRFGHVVTLPAQYPKSVGIAQGSLRIMRCLTHRGPHVVPGLGAAPTLIQQTTAVHQAMEQNCMVCTVDSIGFGDTISPARALFLKKFAKRRYRCPGKECFDANAVLADVNKMSVDEIIRQIRDEKEVEYFEWVMAKAATCTAEEGNRLKDLATAEALTFFAPPGQQQAQPANKAERAKHLCHAAVTSDFGQEVLAEQKTRLVFRPSDKGSRIRHVPYPAAAFLADQVMTLLEGQYKNLGVTERLEMFVLLDLLAGKTHKSNAAAKSDMCTGTIRGQVGNYVVEVAVPRGGPPCVTGVA